MSPLKGPSPRLWCQSRIRPAGIVGTSIGALVGALAASGMSASDMRDRALALKRRDIRNNFV